MPAGVYAKLKKNKERTIVILRIGPLPPSWKFKTMHENIL